MVLDKCGNKAYNLYVDNAHIKMEEMSWTKTPE